VGAERLGGTPTKILRTWPREAILIISPNARRASASLDRARAELARAGITIIDEIPIESIERLEKHLSKGPRHLVAVAGGDGTVGSVANKVANRRATMAIFPLGTCNDFARALGIPTNITKAVRLLNEGKESTVDLGRLVVQKRPPRHFVHAAAVGVSVGFAKLATRAALRQRLGRLTYIVSWASALWHRRPFQCRLTVDGYVEELALLQLLINNTPVFGGFLGLRIPDSNVDDRIFDVIAIEDVPLHKLALVGVLLVLRHPLRVTGIRTFRVGCVRVHAYQPLDVALDGEVVGSLPAEFDVAKDALRVIIPLDVEDIDV
jgi:diacylglycerol kinase (ATP)